MRSVFMGSAELSCPALAALLDSGLGPVAAVVTQPARPRGRRLQTALCPASELAARRGVPVLSPERVNHGDAVAAIRACAPDVIVVVAYGQILGDALLALPPLGCVNVHASLLPRYRGAAPIQWAIANGDTVSGVTTLYMNRRMDEGDVILQRQVPIGPEDTSAALHGRLAAAGAELLLETLRRIGSGTAPRVPQDASQATYAPKLKKEDGRIVWDMPAGRICARVRAFHPWPGSVCVVPGAAGDVLRVLRCRAEDGGGPPGVVLGCGSEGPLIAAGQGAVRLLAVQPPGRGPMTGAAYVCGHALRVGERLG